MPEIAIERFVEKSLRLLELERQAEIEEAERLQAAFSAHELEKRGWCLARLKIADQFTGPGGRAAVVLEPSRGGDLPAHRFQPGDLVSARALHAAAPARSRAAPPATAVVYRVDRRRIVLLLDEAPEEDLEEPLRVDHITNDITYQRLRGAMERLRRPERGPAARLREVLFGRREPAMEAARAFEPINSSLDASQRQAAEFALGARDLALIHGPPGTGKTTTLVEVILQAVKRKEKVLACAPSNLAVDNLAERLAAFPARLVRLGHPARLLPSVLGHSLDALLEASEGERIARVVRRELEEAYRGLRKSRDRPSRRELRDSIRRLKDELAAVEERAVRHLLSSADVVLATTAGAGDERLGGMEFDRVVIDEAAQALEAACWIPLLRGRSAVLGGDHLQLPPTIRSREAERGGLNVTLFGRLAEGLGERVTRLLTVQYRMHEEIMRWPSQELYHGSLQAHESVRRHLLADLPHVSKAAGESVAALPLLFIDTAGCGLEEVHEEESESKANDGEVEIAAAHVEALLASGVRPAEVGVITPYNAQVERLRRRLSEEYPELEIDTVDGFQGREKEAVVISLVRSNPEGEVGFLKDDRRLNVALTRARRHLAVIGDSATVSSHPFLARLLEHLQVHGEHRSAWEYR
ncbi:MAG: IGHMBP2 family helicase [Planctomycetes bacterium]|nr:IGHMBP2 family helicase [Planctomycetota bacterium]